jgi:hypothetical protein
VQLRAEWEPGGHRHVPGRLPRHDRLQGMRRISDTPCHLAEISAFEALITSIGNFILSFLVAEDLILSLLGITLFKIAA